MSTQSPTLPATKPPMQAFLILAVGVIAVSLSALFIRLAQGEQIPSLAIAALRLTAASLLLTPITLRRYKEEVQKLTRKEVLLAATSGIFLAGHFATWMLSLEYTSVLISTVLVDAYPLWVALLEIFFLRTRLGRLVILGLIIGILGSIFVAMPPKISQFMATGAPPQALVDALVQYITDAVSTGNASGANPALGMVLATVGALAVAVYFVIGRKLRATLSLLPYIWLVYSCAALTLLLTCFLGGIRLIGYSWQGYGLILAMAAFPQLLGHSSFNYVLKFFPATYVGIAVQLEPVLAAIGAFFIFQEKPVELQILGSAIVLFGVMLASTAQTRSN